MMMKFTLSLAPLVYTTNIYKHKAIRQTTNEFALL